MKLIISILLQGLLVYATDYLLSGVFVSSFKDAILVAIILALANTFVKPVITILTLPITIVTLGLFLLIINGIVVMLVDALLVGFSVSSFIWAILFSVVFSVFNYFFLKYG